MDPIHNSPLRNGRFTSSEIYRLLSKGKREMTPEELAGRPKTGKGSKTTFVEEGFGKAALTYIQEKKFERRLNRSLDNEVNTRAFAWGHVGERVAFSILDTSHTLSSDETDPHPTIECWAGSKDGLKHDDGKTVFDIKSPLSLKSFCTLVEPIYMGLTGMDAMNWIRENHDDGEKFYQQLVSNSIINDTKYAELIIFAPYRSDLDKIRDVVSDWDDPREVEWIYYANEDQLPLIPDGGFYSNINIIRFEVPEEDKIALTKRVIEAGKLLIK